MSKRRFYGFIALLWTTGLAWLVASLLGHSHSVCLFKYVTNLPCPSCGTTRSMVALLHGNLAEAFLINPLGIILFVITMAVPAWLGLDFLTKKESLHRSYLHMEDIFRQNMLATVTSVALLLLNWFWSISKGL